MNLRDYRTCLRRLPEAPPEVLLAPPEATDHRPVPLGRPTIYANRPMTDWFEALDWPSLKEILPENVVEGLLSGLLTMEQVGLHVTRYGGLVCSVFPADGQHNQPQYYTPRTTSRMPVHATERSTEYAKANGLIPWTIAE